MKKLNLVGTNSLQQQALKKKLDPSDTNIPVQPRNKIAIASDRGLMLCKAAFICRMARVNVPPLAAMRIFDAQLEKYATRILDAFRPMTNARRKKTQTDFLKDMHATGVANSQGIMGFTPQDKVSRRRINAIINGIIATPMTAGAVISEGTKRLLTPNPVPMGTAAAR